MNKRNYLLAFVIVITLLGGFLAGNLSAKHPSRQNQSALKHKRIKPAAKSAKQPAQKSLPHVAKVKSRHVLIGYLQDFRDPAAIDFSKFSHVIFAFAHPTKDGDLLLNGKMAMDHLQQTVSLAHKHNVKAILAVGGWYHIQGGESYKYFTPALANPVSRSKLAAKIASMADQNHLDGIDIDYEYPHSAKEAKNFAAFVQHVSVKLHSRNKELSVAVHAKINSATRTESHYVVYEPSMFSYVDHVNIMAYDGQWDDGYHAENLSPYPFTEEIVNYWSSLFQAIHQPRKKLVLGVPSYAQPETPAAKQVSYAAVIRKSPANIDRDNAKLNGMTYYYNGEPTIRRKTALALHYGFGGMMIWEAGLDAKGSHSLTTAIANELKNIHEAK